MMPAADGDKRLMDLGVKWHTETVEELDRVRGSKSRAGYLYDCFRLVADTIGQRCCPPECCLKCDEDCCAVKYEGGTWRHDCGPEAKCGKAGGHCHGRVGVAPHA